MRIHYLQHVTFEDPAFILDWIKEFAYHVSSTRLYANDVFPEPSGIDLLIIMGGPMSIHNQMEYPWLKQEKQFIKEVIQSGKPVLGICLGAQLIAHVLGAKVYPNLQKEIGWFPIKRQTENELVEKLFPEEFTAFHWHGETFDIPNGASLIGSSEACQNQGFIYKDKVIALQFHLECTYQSIESLVENCDDEMIDAPFIQEKSTILNTKNHFQNSHTIVSKILNHLSSII